MDIEEEENVFFVQISADVYNDRDAIRFANGFEVLLQGLPAGIRVYVLSLGNTSADSEKDFAVPSRYV